MPRFFLASVAPQFFALRFFDCLSLNVAFLSVLPRSFSLSSGLAARTPALMIAPPADSIADWGCASWLVGRCCARPVTCCRLSYSLFRIHLFREVKCASPLLPGPRARARARRGVGAFAPAPTAHVLAFRERCGLGTFWFLTLFTAVSRPQLYCCFSTVVSKRIVSLQMTDKERSPSINQRNWDDYLVRRAHERVSERRHFKATRHAKLCSSFDPPSNQNAG